MVAAVWTVILLEQVESWLIDLARHDPDTADQVEAAIDLLADQGPTLGRPAVDRVKGSRLHNLKELRPGSAAGSEVRVLFIFGPDRQAILLAAGDKAGAWRQWYRQGHPARRTALRRLAGRTLRHRGVTMTKTTPRAGTTTGTAKTTPTAKRTRAAKTGTAKSWTRVRGELAQAGLLDEQRVTAARRQLEQAVRAQRLAEVRKAHGETQTGLAARMKVSQSRVSKIERGDLARTEIATLQSYIEALGGRLEVTAQFDDQRITVR